jgi:hypothetical protein
MAARIATQTKPTLLTRTSAWPCGVPLAAPVGPCCVLALFRYRQTSEGESPCWGHYGAARAWWPGACPFRGVTVALGGRVQHGVLYNPRPEEQVLDTLLCSSG